MKKQRKRLEFKKTTDTPIPNLPIPLITGGCFDADKLRNCTLDEPAMWFEIARNGSGKQYKGLPTDNKEKMMEIFNRTPTFIKDEKDK